MLSNLRSVHRLYIPLAAMSSSQPNTKGKRSKNGKESGASPAKQPRAKKDHIAVSTIKETKASTSTSKTSSVASSPSITNTKSNRLSFAFYDVECSDLAKALLGQTLVHVVDGERLAGKIVETEAYIGPIDKAAHSYNGKRTARNEAMFMPPGTAYVYNIYGMYCCVNISSKGEGAAVLIRALEPTENIALMDKNRTGESGKSLLKNDGKDLCNGPSKLCRALCITKDTTNQVDMCTSDDIWLEKGDIVEEGNIVKSKRINIGYGEEWVDKLLRFYVLGNKCVSVKDKDAEKAMVD